MVYATAYQKLRCAVTVTHPNIARLIWEILDSQERVRSLRESTELSMVFHIRFAAWHSLFSTGYFSSSII